MKSLRQKQILDYVNANTAMSVNKAVEVFRASAPTIRRDFNDLARLGEVSRYYGGIRRMREPPDQALPISIRKNWFTLEKRALAAEAFKDLPSEGVIFVDGGTTTAHIGMLLNSPKLRVITNSLALYEVMMKRFPLADGPELLLSGGIVNAKSAILIGPESERTFSRFHARALLFSGTAIDENFIYDNRDDVAAMQRQMIANSDKMIVIAGSDKLGATAMCKVEPVCRITHFISDARARNHPVINALRLQGVKVTILPGVFTETAGK